MKLCLLLAAATCLSVAAWAGPTAEQLYKEGQKAERAGQTVRAYLLYAEAAAADPANPLYWARAQALRPASSLRSATLDSSPSDAPVEMDPTLFGTLSDRDLQEGRKPLPPSELKAAPGRKDFDLRGDSKSLFEQVAAAFGLLVLFDTAYQPGSTIRLRLNDVDYRDALRALEAATGSFITPVSQRLMFVANDNPQKRTEFESTAAVTIPIPEPVSIQEVQEIATAVRGTLDIQRLLIDNQRRLVLIRDRVNKVRLAEKLFLDMMHPRPQVAIEVEILTTDRTSSLSYGLSLPTNFPLVSFGPKPRNLLTTLPAGFARFLAFGSGASLIGIGLTDANLFAMVSKATSTTVLRSEIVSVDGQAASLHVGDKYPIVTNGYFGATKTSGQVFTPPPTFNFEDLGLVLKVTPHVHGTEEISLEIDAEFKLLGATAVDGIPVISNRKYESKVRLVTGQWAVLAGLMTGSDARTITGIPGVSLVPFLRSNTHNRDNSETLIVLKPHLLILPPTESVTKEAWVGTETKLRSEL